jgi:hypothetical protein
MPDLALAANESELRAKVERAVADVERSQKEADTAAQQRAEQAVARAAEAQQRAEEIDAVLAASSARSARSPPPRPRAVDYVVVPSYATPRERERVSMRGGSSTPTATERSARRRQGSPQSGRRSGSMLSSSRRGGSRSPHNSARRNNQHSARRNGGATDSLSARSASSRGSTSSGSATSAGSRSSADRVQGTLATPAPGLHQSTAQRFTTPDRRLNKAEKLTADDLLSRDLRGSSKRVPSAAKARPDPLSHAWAAAGMRRPA